MIRIELHVKHFTGYIFSVRLPFTLYINRLQSAFPFGQLRGTLPQGEVDKYRVDEPLN